MAYTYISNSTMPHPHFNSLLHKEMTRKEFLALGALAAISIFGFVGVLEELLSHAATPYATDEAQNGTRSGTTNLTSSTGSASSQVVKFGTASASSNSQALMLGMNLGDSSGFNGSAGAAGNAGMADHGAAAFAEMYAAGIRTIRLDVGVGYYGNPGPIPLAGNMDAVIKNAYAAGLEILCSISAYANMTQATYVTFCSDLVAYYSQAANGNVKYYEIMNEVALGQGSWIVQGAIPTPAEYAPLLKAAYVAIKAADPSSYVLIGSLVCGSTNGTYDGAGFMQALYSLMGGSSTGYFDIMNVHAYTNGPSYGSGYGTELVGAGNLPNLNIWWWQEAFNPTATTTLANNGAAIPSVRYQMVAAGDENKPIWLTEFGAPTGTLAGYTGTCTYNGEAQLYLAAFQTLQTNNLNFVERIYAYVWADSDDDFGLKTYQYQDKAIDGTFSGLPSGVTTVLGAYSTGCTYPSKFSGTLYS
jgi:hypothetical protein